MSEEVCTRFNKMSTGGPVRTVLVESEVCGRSSVGLTNGRGDCRLGIVSSLEKFGSQANKRKRAGAGRQCGVGDA